MIDEDEDFEDAPETLDPELPSVTFIGSCRIHRPLNALQAAGRLNVRKEGFFGYTHTTKESIQQILFRAGELDFDPDLVPYIKDPKCELQATPEVFVGVETVFVEISAKKGVELEGAYVTTPRFDKAVVRRHPELAGWTTDLIAGQAGDPASYGADLADPIVARLMGGARLVFQDQETVLADMARIRELIAGRLVFVTHFEMKDRRGRDISARRQVREWVAEGAQGLGVPVFDPSEVIRAFGRSKAVRDRGHYNAEFIAALGDHLYDAFLAPVA